MKNDALRLEFKTLLAQRAQHEGVITTMREDVMYFKQSQAHKRRPELYQAAVFFMASGQKRCYVDEQSYHYGAGQYLMMFLPMRVEVEAFDVSPESPLLLAGLLLDLNRIADLILKLDRLAEPLPQVKHVASTGILTAAIEQDLLEPLVQLIKVLDDPIDAAMLSEGIIDQIYYRLLCTEHASALRHHLQINGQIQQIAKAIAFIHQHIDQPVQVDQLAAMAHMSTSHFHKSFREVMKVSPLQYAKSMKLFRAQTLLKEGKKVNQAAYAVGYNSSTQFSREYKRQFGLAPSDAR